MARPRDVAKRTSNPSAPDLEFLTIRDVLTEQIARLYANSIRSTDVWELQQKVGECSAPYILLLRAGHSSHSSVLSLAFVSVFKRDMWMTMVGWVCLPECKRLTTASSHSHENRGTNRFVRRCKGTPQVLSASRCLFPKDHFD